MVGDPNFLSRSHVAAAGAEGGRDGTADLLDALEDELPGFGFEFQLFSCHGVCSLFLDDAEDIFLTHNLVFLLVNLDFGPAVLRHQNRVAFLDIEGNLVALLVKLARAHGNDFALGGFFLGGIGMMMPPFFTSSASFMGSTNTRSPNGWIFMLRLLLLFCFFLPTSYRHPPGRCSVHILFQGLETRDNRFSQRLENPAGCGSKPWKFSTSAVSSP